MATVKSFQVTDIDAKPAVKLGPSELAGRSRKAHFSFDTGASGPAVGDIVELVELPEGARVLGISMGWEAMSSGAGTAGADYGDSGDADRFITALNMEAASDYQPRALRVDGTNALREPAFGVGFKYSAKTRVTATVTGEAWANNATLRGTVDYQID